MNQNTLSSSPEVNQYAPAEEQPVSEGKEMYAHPEHMQEEGADINDKVQSHFQQDGEVDEEVMAADYQGGSSLNGGSLYSKLPNGQHRSIPSKPSSISSLDTANEGKSSAPPKQLIATPSTESQFDGKTSFSSFAFSSGGKDRVQGPQINALSKGHSDNQFDQDDSFPQEREHFPNQEASSSPQKLAPFSDNHFQSRNRHSITESSLNGERVRRSCRDKTSRYSLTHKGVFTNLKAQDVNDPKLQAHFQQPGVTRAKTRKESMQEVLQTESTEDQPQVNQKPHKKGHVRTAAECIDVFKNMLAFDWDLKDIVNLRHSPQQELTHSVFWFYVNAMYFPFRALQISQEPFEEFAEPILQNFKPFNNTEELKTNDEQIQNNDDDVKLLQSLFNDKKFAKFKKLFKDLSERALQESFKKQEPENGLEVYDNETMTDIDSSLERQQLSKFQTMIDVLKKEIHIISESNQQQLHQQFSNLHETYTEALISEPIHDPFVYQPDHMFEYDNSFLAQVDPGFVQDLRDNMEWYLENYNEILLNVGYPSRQEKDFLKHIEQVQQKKNDQKYKKILKQIEQGKKGGHTPIDDERYQNLSMHKRALVNQEDAQCAICNSGDYEDEDLIVFCGNCNIPVHQSCYGIDQLPDGDWICYNCDIYGFKKGLLVGCLVCPKKGGAMKPTNIFSSKEYYKKYNSGSGSGHSHKKGSAKKHHSSHGDKGEGHKSQLFEREDKSLSLAVILKREFEHESEVRANLEELQQLGHHQPNDIELHFDQNEKERQIPDDYNYFIQRNEPRLESQFTPQTDTLYEWVHLSCASWIPGPIVTPKTPVRLNKLDDKRFALQCIICLKKDGACMQCQATRCTIAFHVECARRANYCMEIERRDRDKSYKMFCEKHRPLKIVKEMEEKDRQTVDEIQRFCKIIEKCTEIDQKAQLKQVKQEKEGTTHKAAQANKSDTVREKSKKWREKDKKTLFERVKEKYLLFKKMRVNVIRVDPFKKLKKQTQQRKRSKKRQSKKLTHKGGCREGLRSQPGSFLIQPTEPLEIISEQGANATEENYDINEDNKEEEDLQTHHDQEQHLMEGYEEEHNEVHYKFNTPMFPTEVEWTITLSRNDFPWHEVRFGNYSAKECFEKYQSVVKDSQTFLKKVLGLKEKYKKMMQNQLQVSAQPQSVIVPLVGGGTYDSSVYCRCQGTVQSDFFVKCDGDDECPNGGWVHPQCTTDLKNRPQAELDTMEEWYCEDCVERIKNEDDEDKLQENAHIDEDDLQSKRSSIDGEEHKMDVEAEVDHQQMDFYQPVISQDSNFSNPSDQ